MTSQRASDAFPFSTHRLIRLWPHPGSTPHYISVTFYTLDLPLYPEDSGSTFLRNVPKHLPDYMASQNAVIIIDVAMRT
jgi:hypothetical protein